MIERGGGGARTRTAKLRRGKGGKETCRSVSFPFRVGWMNEYSRQLAFPNATESNSWISPDTRQLNYSVYLPIMISKVSTPRPTTRFFYYYILLCLLYFFPFFLSEAEKSGLPSPTTTISRSQRRNIPTSDPSTRKTTRFSFLFIPSLTSSVQAKMPIFFFFHSSRSKISFS